MRMNTPEQITERISQAFRQVTSTSVEYVFSTANGNFYYWTHNASMPCLMADDKAMDFLIKAEKLILLSSCTEPAWYIDLTSEGDFVFPIVAIDNDYGFRLCTPTGEATAQTCQPYLRDYTHALRMAVEYAKAHEDVTRAQWASTLMEYADAQVDSLNLRRALDAAELVHTSAVKERKKAHETYVRISMRIERI